jgi:hypothetical protein
MKFKTLVALVVTLFTIAAVQAAMTVTLYQPDASLERISAAFVSAADGTVSQAITIRGTIVRVVTDPGATAPTTLWDITCPDANGVDLFAAQGADRSATVTEHFVPGVPFKDGTTAGLAPVVYMGTATLTITNAGNAKNGTVIVYVQKSTN